LATSHNIDHSDGEQESEEEETQEDRDFIDDSELTDSD
jgi:hypothetical protein